MGNSIKKFCNIFLCRFGENNHIIIEKEPLLENETENKILTFKDYNSEYKKYNKDVNLNDFRIIKTLGKGSFGKVILVQHIHLKTYYAMKVLLKEQLKQTNQILHTKSEREILEKISHPFIVKLIFAFQNPEKLYIVTEYMAGGEIFYHLRKERKFSEERTRIYLCEIILALEHLHINNIIYRDLKPENILLDKHGHIKLTDFGLSKILKYNVDQSINQSTTSSFASIYSKAFTICGTPEYLAPEILNGKGYDKSVDWWSLGVVAFEMFCGYSPFKENKHKLDINTYKKSIKKENHLTSCAFDLLEKLLNVDSNRRLGGSNLDADEIKKHPFFNGIKWKNVFEKKYKPIFVPNLKDEEDISNFDKIFTDEDPKYVGIDQSTIFARENSDNKYDDFTYVNKFLT